MHTDLVAEYRHLNEVSGFIGAQQAYGGGVGGHGIGVKICGLVLAIGIDLYGRYSVIVVDRDIQQQRSAIIGKLELLPDQTGGGSSLPAYFVMELTSHAVLAYKTRAQRQSLAGVVQGILEGILVKVIVKHYVTDIGQTEIGQRKAQYEIWITITHSITEQRTASEVGTRVCGLIAKTDAIDVIDVKKWRLINTGFLLCFHPVHTVIDKS